MNSRAISSNEFVNKDVNASLMLNHRLGIESIPSIYFTEMSGYFHEQDICFIDGLYWNQNGVSSSENVQGYVVQGDLFWDDLDENGMIDMYHQTQETGYIADIYDSSHESWNGCGYGWAQGGPDSIEEIHKIAVDAYFDSYQGSFAETPLYFGDWYRASNHSPVDITEDFSKIDIPAELFTEKTPTIVSGWTERGI